MSVEQTATARESPPLHTLVTFQLDRQTFALPLAPIVKIVEMVTITPVPQASPAVEGVIRVHGAVVPVVNLRRHLGLPTLPLQLHTPIILVKFDQWLVGLIVDNVLDVIQMPVQQIARPAEVLPADLGDAPILQGVAHTPGGTLLLLDPAHLFRPDQAQALAQVIAALSQAASSTEYDPAPVSQPSAATRQRRWQRALTPEAGA